MTTSNRAEKSFYRFALLIERFFVPVIYYIKFDNFVFKTSALIFFLVWPLIQMFTFKKVKNSQQCQKTQLWKYINN